MSSTDIFIRAAVGVIYPAHMSLQAVMPDGSAAGLKWLTGLCLLLYLWRRHLRILCLKAIIVNDSVFRKIERYGYGN